MSILSAGSSGSIGKVINRANNIGNKVINNVNKVRNTINNVQNTINKINNIGRIAMQNKIGVLNFVGGSPNSGLSGLFNQSILGELPTMEVAQVYITQVETEQQLQLSMTPEKINVKFAQNFRTFNIIHLGEIKLPRGEKLTGISWNGILPGRNTTAYKFVNAEAWVEPKEIIKQIEDWKNNHWEKNTSKLRLMITQTPINLDVYIDNFSHNYSGGQGNVEYNISFIAAKDILVRTVEEIDGKSSEQLEERPTTKSETVEVKSGDCLWSIAQQKLGDGSRWQEIYDLNKDKISDPDLIYPGQEFQLPAK